MGMCCMMQFSLSGIFLKRKNSAERSLQAARTSGRQGGGTHGAARLYAGHNVLFPDVLKSVLPVFAHRISVTSPCRSVSSPFGRCTSK